ncbi:hypothetical protein B9Z65_901 [Elsinoe australis]|uniref:Defect at low temperature protein 1 n=1 Tax=Elsinoe australis TaxID=40998 RepID=A0A2P8AJX7_9PEZI|nr:hypothetical protein B9Z65_901 [Elsinoe australis]
MARRLRLPFRIPLLRIFYSTTYTGLFVLELLLLAITPTALIFSAISERALQYIVIIGGVYVLTALLVLFIYSSRLYTNRTVLAALGKSYIPVEEGEVSKSVRKLIKTQLDRSAAIALECRPRDLSDAAFTTHDALHDDGHGRQIGRLAKVNPTDPPWGIVKHPGWSAPNPNETQVMPHVFFLQVLGELPNLLEARVVSLGGAPRSSDPRAPKQSGYPGSQKPPLLGMREYLNALDSEGRVIIPESAQQFIEGFEKARFSGRPLSEDDFVSLTLVFADLLSSMQTNEDFAIDFRATNSTQPSADQPLTTIEDRMSPDSASDDSISFRSGSDSTTTVSQIRDNEYRSPAIRSATPATGIRNRTGSVLVPSRTSSAYSSQASSRLASTASLESVASVIQQAQAGRERRRGM